MNVLQSMIIGISMYSKIPMPRVEWNEKNMKYAMCSFPLVGAVIGVVIWLVGTLLLKFRCPELVFAAAMTLIPILITGGIHMDGFMDTMDALSSYGDKEKKLAILKDTHTGAFAILGMGCYLVWNVAVWSMIPQAMLPVISAGYVMTRSMSGFSIMNFPSARKDGLGKTFQEGAQRKTVSIVMVLWFLAAAAVMLYTGKAAGVLCLVGALLVFWYYHHMAMKQFGGMTGDLAGYFLQMCELMILTAAAVAGGMPWNFF